MAPALHMSHRMWAWLLRALACAALAGAALTGAAPPPTEAGVGAGASCPQLDAARPCVCRRLLREVACDGLGARDLRFLASSASAGVAVLSAAHNRLRRLADDVLPGGAANLTQLRLSHNEIASVDMRHLQALSSLRILDLSYNQLTEFYMPENAMPALRILRLTDNYLFHVRIDANRPNDGLDQLFLSRNKIGNNLDFVRNLTNLRLLTLASNDITEVPTSALPCNPSLQYLRLNNNRLRDLRFLECTQFLIELNVSGNMIVKIPERTFENITLLSILRIADNKITNSDFLPYVAAHVQLLDLSRNKLSHISRINLNTKLLDSLNYVDVSHNELTDINFVGSIKNLTTLLANNNKISEIKDEVFLRFGYGNVIKRLNLNDNLISDISFLAQLSNISSFNSSNNKLFHIPEDTMTQLKYLKFLDLSNNRISDVSFVQRAPFLYSLDLSNNIVTKNPCNSVLQRLYLNGNNISSLHLKCAPRLSYISMYGGVMRDRKGVELSISKEVLLEFNDHITILPCVPTTNTILKCKEGCSSLDGNEECETQDTIFISPVAMVIYSICISLCLLVIFCVVVNCFKLRRRRVDKGKQCLCNRCGSEHLHQPLTTQLRW